MNFCPPAVFPLTSTGMTRVGMCSRTLRAPPTADQVRSAVAPSERVGKQDSAVVGAVAAVA